MLSREMIGITLGYSLITSFLDSLFYNS